MRIVQLLARFYTEIRLSSYWLWTHSPESYVHVIKRYGFRYLIDHNYRKKKRAIKNMFKKGNRMMKNELVKLYGTQCQRCKRRFPFDGLTVDHIKPRYYGGEHEIDNCQLLCHVCHNRKSRREDPSRIEADRKIRALEGELATQLKPILEKMKAEQ